VKTHFELSAAEYERSRGGHLGRRRRQLVERELEAHVTDGATVLEIGCGPGALLAEIAGERPELDFLGVDVESRMIEHARKAHAGENVTYELVDLGEESPSFEADFAFSIDLLHHVHDLPPFLAGVHSVLRPGATWLVIEPNVFHPYIHWSQARMKGAGLDEDHFRPSVVEPLFRGAGLDLASRRYAFLFPGWIEHVPRVLTWAESALERFRLTGGSIVYLLERC
jgi:trans-aconitate methyltransferase